MYGIKDAGIMYSGYADIMNRLYLHADASLFTQQGLSTLPKTSYYMPAPEH